MPCSICMAMDRSWKAGCTRPPQLQLLRAWKGIIGSRLQRAVVHDLHSHTGSSGMPTPADEGEVRSVATPTWLDADVSMSPTCSAAAPGVAIGTLRVLSSHR